MFEITEKRRLSAAGQIPVPPVVAAAQLADENTLKELSKFVKTNPHLSMTAFPGIKPYEVFPYKRDSGAVPHSIVVGLWKCLRYDSLYPCGRLGREVHVDSQKSYRDLLRHREAIANEAKICDVFNQSACKACGVALDYVVADYEDNKHSFCEVHRDMSLRPPTRIEFGKCAVCAFKRSEMKIGNDEIGRAHV